MIYYLKITFILHIQQSLDLSNVSANNTLFVQGSYTKKTLSGNVTTNKAVDIGFPVRAKDHINLNIKGIPSTEFNLANNNTEVIFTTPENNFDYYMEIDKYDVPVFEISDVVTLDTGETFSVVDSTYAGANANSELTSAYIYSITLNKTPQSNLYGQYITNISRNPTGLITDSNNGSISINSTYTGEFSLSNVYTIADNYQPERFLDEKILDVDQGAVAVLARNRNEAGILSP